jgi:hypothetical protein
MFYNQPAQHGLQWKQEPSRLLVAHQLKQSSEHYLGGAPKHKVRKLPLQRGLIRIVAAMRCAFGRVTAPSAWSALLSTKNLGKNVRHPVTECGGWIQSR